MSSVSYFMTEELDMFRTSVDDFVKANILPYFNQWEKDGRVNKDLYTKAAELGLLGINIAPEYGGMGLNDMFSLVWLEQGGRHNIAGAMLSLCTHSYLPMQYLHKFASEEIKQKYLVPSVDGKIIGCLGMTEPFAGSDLAALRTTAIREGDHYIVNGSKTFITNGVYADYMVTAVKTDPNNARGGISLLVIDTKSEGYTASKLDKLGVRSSDTAEIAMLNVKVPVTNLIGEEGKGFLYMMKSLEIERFSIAWACLGGCLGVMDVTLKYINEREAFGKPISKLQTIRHKIVDLETEIETTRAFMYLTTQRFANGENTVKEATMLKYKTAELLNRASNECLQFFGGYGFMEEFPIARVYRDQRVNPIYGGTSEIMKEILSKIIVDGVKY
jgi:alkylation response protein AidB-like acyl-CoA dehydrogenase